MTYTLNKFDVSVFTVACAIEDIARMVHGRAPIYPVKPWMLRLSEIHR